MKKFVKLFACIGLLFSLSACSGSKIEDEAIDRLETSVKKFSELSSFNYTMGVDMPTINGNMELYGTFLNEGELQMSMAMDITAEEQKMEKFMEMYFKDDMMYMSAFGVNQKQEADFSSLDGISFDPDTMSFDREQLKENLSEATIKGDTLHLTIKDEVVKNSVDEENLATLGINEITKMSMDIELENDFMKNFTITVTGNGEDGEATFNIYLNFGNINSAEAITFPSGMEDWPTETAFSE